MRSRHEVTTVTLQHVLERVIRAEPIDLLSIDVENHDFEVLTSFDIQAYRPRVIVIEMHGFAFDAQNESNVYSYLVAHGYE